VTAGLTLSHTSGVVEGHVNRINSSSARCTGWRAGHISGILTRLGLRDRPHAAIPAATTVCSSWFSPGAVASGGRLRSLWDVKKALHNVWAALHFLV
jgi:hypothetical protein